MDESILESVKKALGIMPDYQYFDDQLILYINAALAVLVQTGVGTAGFVITGPESKWSDFLGEKMTALEYSKVYVSMKVRLMFDHPRVPERFRPSRTWWPSTSGAGISSATSWCWIRTDHFLKSLIGQKKSQNIAFIIHHIRRAPYLMIHQKGRKSIPNSPTIALRLSAPLLAWRLLASCLA